MSKTLSVASLLLVVFSTTSQLISQTAKCGGINQGGSSFILPSTSSVDALVIYTYFPSDTLPGVDENVPGFASAVAQHVEDYYDEMSYNTHLPNIQIIQRSGQNEGKAFLADSSATYYQSSLTELNTEILNKAWQENNNVFNGIEVVFMFYGGGVLTFGTGWAELPETSSNYSGLGAMMEWGGWGSAEEKVQKWNMAHEYGHLLSPDGTSGNRIRDQVTQPGGIYNIMHNVYFNGTQPMAAFNLIHLGWIESSWIKEIDPTQSGDQSQTVTIKDTRVAPSGGNYNVARIHIPGTTNEHFLIENRQGTGSDSSLSENGEGLIIWHLDKPESQYNRNYDMDVEIATAIDDHGEDWLDDGVQLGSENRGFITDFFNDSNKPDFAPWTNPSTESGYKYSDPHSFTDLGIMDVSSAGSGMTFDFVENAQNAPPGPPQNLDISNPGEDGENPSWCGTPTPNPIWTTTWSGAASPQTGRPRPSPGSRILRPVSPAPPGPIPGLPSISMS